MNAQHLAVEHEEKKLVHPLMHVATQQELAKAVTFKSRKKKWGGISPKKDGGFYFFPLVIYLKFVVIQTCTLENHSDMNTAKKQKAISGKRKAKSKKPDRIVSIDFSPEFTEAMEQEGYDIKEVEDVILQFVNRSESSRRKYVRLAHASR